HLERVTGIEPALAYWIYAGQDLKSCVLPLHYTRNGYKDNENTTKCSPHVLSFAISRANSAFLFLRVILVLHIRLLPILPFFA
ncbi:MAG: hypothetical protein IJL56_01450, partial [Bacteroidales bacterium]|nr:hypothetical protein [Bacteroidales bacterium]